MDYIKYVEEQIEKWQSHVKIINDQEKVISPYLLNKVLGEYQEVNLTLLSELQRAKTELFRVQSVYQIWWDEKYMEARSILNPDDKSASKWASTREIESYTRINNKKEYLEWKDRLFELEASVSFMRRLTDQWKKFDNILTTISNNMRAEIRALSIVDRSNKADNTDKEINVRQVKT